MAERETRTSEALVTAFWSRRRFFVVFVLTDCRCFDRWVIVLLIVVISGFLADLMLSFAVD